MVAKREADLSMNLALTGARERVIDYSVAYMGKSVTFYGYSLSSYGLLSSLNGPVTSY